MKFLIDTHTHTVSSGHAYSTIQEMARGAAENGIEMIAMTDHGPAMKGAPHLYHFGNLRVIPKELYGVRIVKGVEANIIDYNGKVDMPDEYLKALDFVIASFHDIVIAPSTIEEHTNAVINVLKNPYIDAIAHPGNPQFQIDIEKVVNTAKEYNKFIEINNQSFVIRLGSTENCKEIAKKCKEKRVRVVCGSDAHISFDVGKFDRVYDLFKEIDMPQELIINCSLDSLEEYLKERKARIKGI